MAAAVPFTLPVRALLRLDLLEQLTGPTNGPRPDALRRWLSENVGRGEYAVQAGGRHPSANGLEDRLAVYTRHPGTAVALLAALSDLDLSDGTEAISYRSPDCPFGRDGRFRKAT